MKISSVYKIQSIIKPDRCYIGSAINLRHRWDQHKSDLKLNKHSNNKLQNHYNKYGKEDLVFVIIEPCFPEFLIIREQFYIDTLKPYFNIRKIANSQLGVKRSDETKLKISLASKGRKASEETKIKMSERMKKQIAWNKGLKCSDTHKRNISKANKGIPKPDGFGMKIKEIWRIRKLNKSA